jgi:hypothetical protein
MPQRVHRDHSGRADSDELACTDALKPSAPAAVDTADGPARAGADQREPGEAGPDGRGQTLRRLHDAVPGFVHGAYGPQNLLLEPGSLEVVAVLDWEFAHDGDPVEDLAWTERIVRMHHGNSAQNLPALFQEYGRRPAWPLRHTAMQNRCMQFAEICLRRGDQAAAEMWRSREQLTRNWRE